MEVIVDGNAKVLGVGVCWHPVHTRFDTTQYENLYLEYKNKVYQTSIVVGQLKYDGSVDESFNEENKEWLDAVERVKNMPFVDVYEDEDGVIYLEIMDTYQTLTRVSKNVAHADITTRKISDSEV